ncbi:MAG: type II secretion system protein [Poseidonibacter sp.]|uniref:type II secretion system protein n=1 Tax=Poseidonibacter sp. TaxID=2321188 RepID=UPI00359EE708
MKRSFSLLELVIVILLLSLLYTIFISKTKISKIDEVTNRLIIYLKQTRYQAMIDNKYDENSTLWYKSRWTMKFFRCRKDQEGIYYVIYSDKNKTGHPSVEDTLKDPLTNKNIYSSNYCLEKNENSKYVLLSKYYGIKDINISCNNTSTLGQISFASNGKIYSKLSNNGNEAYEYEITDKCYIELIDESNEKRTIELEPKTSYIRKINNK